MRTSKFLEELARFGWRHTHTKKHIMLENVLIQVDRPLALRKQDEREIDPPIVSVQAKHAGLIWDQKAQALRLNPAHPYYPRYQQALGLKAA